MPPAIEMPRLTNSLDVRGAQQKRAQSIMTKHQQQPKRGMQVQEQAYPEASPTKVTSTVAASAVAAQKPSPSGQLLSPPSTHTRTPPSRHPSSNSIGSLNTFYSTRRCYEQGLNYSHHRDDESNDNHDFDDQKSVRSMASSSAASGATRPRYLIGGNNSGTWSLGSEEITMDKLPKRIPRRSSESQVKTTATTEQQQGADKGVPPVLPKRSVSSTEKSSAATGVRKYPSHVCLVELDHMNSDVASAATSPSQIFQSMLTLKRNRGAATVSGYPASSLSVASIPMASKSHHSYSSSVQSLLDLASKVVNSSSLGEATALYNSAMQASGQQIMKLNNKSKEQQQQQQQQPKEKSTEATATAKAAYHRELRAIGTIIGLLRTRMALMHCVQDDFEKAMGFCDGAIQVHSHQPTLKDNINGAKKLHEVDELSGLMLLIIERLKKARHALASHFGLLQRIDALSVGTTEGGDVSLSGTSMLFENFISPDATPREIVFEIIEQSVRAEDESTVGLYDESMLEILSIHAVENDRQDEAIKFFRDAVQIHLVALGLKHRTLGQSLIRIAKMYRGTGNDRENEKLVLGYFHQTAAVLKRSNLGNRERGSILNDIAVVHMRRCDFDEAIKFLLDALHAYDEDAEEVQKAGRSVASLQVWRNLGECYMHLKKYRSAEGAFLKALDIQDSARRLQETAISLDLEVIGVDKSLVNLVSYSSIADTVCRIGRARAGGGDVRRAQDLYKQALNVIQRGSSEDALLPEQELLVKRDQLTEIFYWIGNACGTLGEINKAFAAYRSALRLRTANGADKFDKRLQTRIHCLKCYGGISDLYMKLNEYDNAIQQLQEALAYAESSNVSKDHAVVVNLRQKLATAETTLALTPDRISQITQLERRADAEIENGTLDKATETLRELLGIRRAMLKNMIDRGLETTDQIYSIACLLQTFGFVFAKNGDDLNAEIAFRDASLLFKRSGRSSEEKTLVAL